MKRLFFVGLFVLILQFGIFAQSGEFDLGIKSANSGDFQTALQHFQNSLDKNISVKKSAQIHYNLGVCFYQLKQTNAAITEFEKAVQIYPNYAKAFYALGMAKTDLRDFNQAENAFRQSLKLSNNGEVWFDLALVLFELKKYDDSAQSFQNAIKFGSVAVAASHNNLGVVYAMQGDLYSAKKELEISEKLNFAGAANNLNIVRNALATNDKTLVAKLILKEK
ncbi:MAG: tetratricopeptide repeat protein [Pyrinomonadaceae bacterium]|nr:tetratricopeptide repeat protein [Pyrinomonadaceae bacterium]